MTFAPVHIKSSILLDMSCIPLKLERCFGVTSRFHLQGINQARNQHKIDLAICLDYPLTFKCRYVDPKRRLIFSGLHATVFHCIGMFIFKVVISSWYSQSIFCTHFSLNHACYMSCPYVHSLMTPCQFSESTKFSWNSGQLSNIIIFFRPKY